MNFATSMSKWVIGVGSQDMGISSYVFVWGQKEHVRVGCVEITCLYGVEEWDGIVVNTQRLAGA